MGNKKSKQPVRDSWRGMWELFFGLHWVWKIVIGAPVLVTGVVAINTILGTAMIYKTAWIGDLPAANKQWAEREIGELKLVSTQQDLHFCQQQNAIWDQKLKQAEYEKSKGQRGYIDEYIRSLREALAWNQRVIDYLLKTNAPSAQQRCKSAG
mgnify:CR=1 FL=1